VLDAATVEFATKGLHGASTDDIAHAAGISQPYLFRLFGTKKELYLATAQRTTNRLYEVFADASRGKTGTEALDAMGKVYTTTIADRNHLMLMLKCWASCDDPEICDVVRSCWRDLVDLAERTSGEPPEVVSAFFSKGALLTVLMAMDAVSRPEPWSKRLIEGCQTGITE
jgi:AcrR family transcriptional regulator